MICGRSGAPAGESNKRFSISASLSGARLGNLGILIDFSINAQPPLKKGDQDTNRKRRRRGSLPKRKKPIVYFWTTKRSTARKWRDKHATEVQAAGCVIKDSLLAACKVGPVMVILQDGYCASIRTTLEASALIVREVRT